MPTSGNKDLYLVDSASIYCGHPEQAKDVNREIKKLLKDFQTVHIIVKNVKILTQEFIRIAFCEFRGMTYKEVNERVKFKQAGLDEHKRYLIQQERKKAKAAEKNLLKEMAKSKSL